MTKAAVALVGIDSIFISEEATARAREAITAATKIPGSHVLIGASHTHGGGPVATCFESEADPEYVDLVAKRVAEAVISAYHSLHAAELGDGIGHEPSISFNRRFLMRDGRQATHPGKGNPDIVKPAGPIDPDVGVLAARAPGGELLGLFVNFACHLTVMGGSGFTADYVYHLARHLRRHYKKPALPVGFLLGAAGDVTQVDNLRPGREFGEEWSSLFGLALGAEVIQTVARLTWRKEAVIQAAQTFVPIPIREPREQPLETPGAGTGLGLRRRQDLCPRTRGGRERTSQTPGDSVRSASHPDRRPRHRHQRRRVFLPARPGYQGGQPAGANLGRQPGQPVDRLRRDPVGLLRRRLRAADRSECQDGPVGGPGSGRRIAGGAQEGQQEAASAER